MEMKELLGFGIVAVGGYFVLKALGVNLTLPGATVGSTSTSPQASNPTADASSRLISAMYTKVLASDISPNSYRTVDVWNTFYAAVKNMPGPAPEDMFPAANRDTTYTFDQYAAGVAHMGLSGLGVIAHYVNPYSNVQATPMGSNLVPSGFEKFIVVKGG